MMNLTDLQVELRKIEAHISQLHLEIENMKPRTEEQKKTDFDAITKLAQKYPIANSEIEAAPELLKITFVNSLSYLLLADENDIYDKLLYLSRLAIGCGLNLSSEDIYKAGLEFVRKNLEQVCIELQQYKYAYVIEALILANLSGEASVNMLTMIADMAKLMDCDKDDICMLAQVAKSKLTGDMELITKVSLPSNARWSGKLNAYIPKAWIESQRVQCTRICIKKYKKVENRALDNGYVGKRNSGGIPLPIVGVDIDVFGIFFNANDSLCVIKHKLQTGSIVYKGDTLLIYETEENKESVSNNDIIITAPNDGMVFFVEEKKENHTTNMVSKFLVVYVVSIFDEYNDFCRWFTKNN